MAQLFSTRLEKKAIKLACSGTKAGDWLFAKLSPELFTSKSTKLAYKRIVSYSNKSGNVISWDDLCEDPVLDEDIRKSLLAFTTPVEPAKSSARAIHSRLSEFRKLRIFADNTVKMDEFLKQQSVDAEVLRQLYDEVLNQTASTQRHVEYVIGDARSQKLVKRILRGSKDTYIPTGFKTFDSVNRGIARGSLFVLGATSGGGKTAVVSQLLDNMTDYGASCVLYSLEMTEEEQYLRMLARRTRTPMTKLIDPLKKLDKERRRKIYRKYKEYAADLQKRGVKLTVVSPDDISIDEILAKEKHKGNDVVAVDYVSLLSGTDGDDQVRKLGSITRKAKVWAKANKKIVILLAQLNDDGLVKYSRAIVENSNNLWLWKRDEKSKTTNLLDIDQVKARNQQAFRFNLLEDFGYMSIIDVPRDYQPPEPANDAGPAKAKRAKKEYTL